MTVLDDLLELEHAGWRSLCEARGAQFYGNIMDDRSLMILANGAVMNRQEVIASLQSAPPWSSYSIDEPTIVELGPDCLGLVYTGTGRRDDCPPFVGIMTSVYVRSPNEWRLALYQQTEKQ